MAREFFYYELRTKSEGLHNIVVIPSLSDCSMN